VIVDEIHAVVTSKRGIHLMLSLERLAALGPNPPAPFPAREGGDAGG
jgi:Lhr-like helicase